MSHRRPTILIVDDVADNIQVLAGALRGDYSVRFARTGSAALASLQTHPLPDLILLDVMMPGMDGYQVCRMLRDAEKTSQIPVIFITARDGERDEEEGFAAGAVDYITKPFHLPVVRARVKTHVELKLKTDLLAELAHLDGLTGIANRRRFDAVLADEWRRAQRSATSLAMLIVDIDYFKRFNDHYGHLAGDRCLSSVAECLDATASRAGDLVARVGGEEFAVLLPGSDQAAAFAVAQRVAERLAALHISHPTSPVADQVTVSIGVAATLPRLADSPTSLFEAADRQLYAAKEHGRNRIEPAPSRAVAPQRLFAT